MEILPQLTWLVFRETADGFDFPTESPRKPRVLAKTFDRIEFVDTDIESLS